MNQREEYGRFNVGQGGDTELRVQIFKARQAQTSKDYSIVLAYGYAFEGHCYRLDSNRIFIVTGPPDEDPVGCGFEPQVGTPALYRMWRIRASTELLEIATNFSDAKTLILDANLPGRKSPTSYAINQTMAHRDGRLTRD
ncbi:hypothetical protein ACYG9Z_23915 [Mesorhizobium sp. RSR380A]|uniref:hypothetical protein n=1 Tax=unclassified Mesorhizobium TaxID=325217 RepID=UPI0003CE5CA3|nr:hypothetical protein X771_31540 [Mesorhizobium sp. LSJC277A00]